MKSRLAFAWMLLLSVSFAESQEQESEPEQQAPYRFEQQVDMVSVAVAVTDQEGNFVTGLAPDRFTVYEDGVKQTITLFAAGLSESWVGLTPELKEELSGKQVIGLILDSSGSMDEEIDLVQQAAIKFLTNVPRTERLVIINFDENIRLSEYSSDDQRLISDRIYGIEPEGWTALYDAVGTFLEQVYGSDGRKTLVVFSDGVDSRSMLNRGEVMEMVKMSDVTIHSILFDSKLKGMSGRSMNQGRFLRDLAKETGGAFAVGTSLEKLDELYDKILEELFSQYALGYVSTNTKRDGRYRKIRVKVDVEDVKIRTRRGYMGPVSETAQPEPEGESRPESAPLEQQPFDALVVAGGIRFPILLLCSEARRSIQALPGGSATSSRAWNLAPRASSP